MSECQRRTNKKEDWLYTRIERLAETPEFQEKLQTIVALQTGHCEAEDQSPLLTLLACQAVSPHQGRPELLERHWASNMGMTWKALREFPERLIKMADDVQHINLGDPAFFARKSEWNVDRDESSNLREVCKQLPASMRSYAEALTARNAYVAKTTPRSGRSKALVDLSNLVNHLTGTYHDRQVADLLNAAAELLGEPRLFTELSIAQARSRRRKRTSPT